MKKFNVQPTLDAFIMVKAKMKKNNLLAYRVHVAMLERKVLTKYANYLRAQLEHLEEVSVKQSEDISGVLLSTFIGKLSLRMPNGITKGKWDDFQKEEMKKIGAALLINVLIDSGEYEIVSRTKQVDPEHNSGKVWKTELFLVFHGEQPTKRHLSYGLETEPGIYYQKMVGDMRLSTEFKYYLSRVSSMAFKASDVMSYELLLHGYKLSKDYNSSNPDGYGEPRAAKKERYKDYASYIMDQIAVIPEFFLPMKYDSRGRMYYLFQLVGMRPQGHLWETLMIDASKPKLLGKAAINHLKHIIYVTKYGRCSVEQSEASITAKDLAWAAGVNALEAKTEKEFGEAILVSKAYQAILLTERGEPCHYLFGKDLTNSGLMMAAACFKSPKMLKMSNLRSLKTVHDSHGDMQISYGLEHLTRKDMKRISNPMLHGASLKSLLNNVQSALRKNGEDEHTVNSVNLEYINNANHEAFGPEVDNIFAISSWGAKVVANNQTKLYWTTPDGFKAYHRAHMAYCPVIVNAATAYNKSGYRESKLVFDMPLKQQSNGQSLYAKGFKAAGSKHPVEVRKTGLYANITHGMDASLVRRVVDLVLAKEEVCLIKHDDYIVFPDAYDEVIEVGQKFFKKASEVNYYKKALEDIAAFGSDIPALPKLKIGKGRVEKSVNYLMP